MARLRHDHTEYTRLGISIVVIGPDSPDEFRKYWAKNDLPFIGIPDPSGAILRRFGQEVNLLKLGRMPAQILVDQRSLAVYAHYGESMSDIPDLADILAIIQS